MRAVIVILVFLGAAATPARAEVKRASAHGFHVHVERTLAAPPARSWERLTDVAHWWGAAHTWSGHSGNLWLTPIAGGCFCERWSGSSVEHARVVAAIAPRQLTLRGSLGPLLPLAVTGVLDIRLDAAPNGHTRLVADYRVSGLAEDDLQALAAPVDRVLGGQFDGLVRLAAEPEANAP